MKNLLTETLFRKTVASANLAPSVHNTQPTRWRMEHDGSITLLLDATRQLAIGDPEGRDARLSCGAALEGTRIALSRAGLRTNSFEKCGSEEGTTLFPVLRFEIGEDDFVDPTAQSVEKRFTWRGGFAASTADQARQIANLGSSRDDAFVIGEPRSIAHLASMNDEASLGFLLHRPYREELRHWMRLSRNHPNWAIDGLNADALGMSGIEALGASIVLRPKIFEMMNALRLGKTIISERTKTKSSTAIVLFHRQAEEDPIDSGVAFYRLLLALTQIGFATWPMAVLADNPDWRAELSVRFGIQTDRRLINVLRVGPPPAHTIMHRARINVADLIA